MALLLQGIARRLLGKPESAIEILAHLSNSCPDAPLVHMQLGLALRESGQYESASQSLRRAVTVKPDFSDAWLALADLLTVMEDFAGADQAFTTYVRYSTNDPLLQEAAAAMRENQFAKAEMLLRNQLEQYPTDIAALCMLADIAECHEKIGEAEILLQQCLKLSPSYQRARHNYAVVLLRQNKAAEALEENSRLLAEDAKNPELRKLRAAILVRLREYEESIHICEALLKEDPDQPSVWTSLGHMLKTVGRSAESIEAYRKAIKLAPHFGEPYWSLANLKTQQVTDQELKAMQTQLTVPNLGYEDRLHFHFSIGKALEERGEYAESFQHYVKGNTLRREKRPYDANELSKHVQRCKTLFTKQFFADRTSCGAPAPDPIFIIGLPRAGSTLVEQILSSHSTVEGTMELTNIAAIAKSLNDWNAAPGESKYPEVLAAMENNALCELGDAYIAQTRIQRKLGTPYFIDKMPNNFAHVGLIHLILPNARIIDVRRHPLACGFSLFKEHFAYSQNFSYNLEDIGHYYRNYVELMAHFDTALPGRIHRIIYESLVEDTETEVRRLLEYCGLPFEAACLEFYKNRRAVSTASSEQVRSPIYRDAINHWSHYEPWLDALKEVVGPLVDLYPEIPAFPEMERSVPPGE